MKQYVLAIDQSTSATKVILVNEAGEIVRQAAHAHALLHPTAEWVEYDAEEIFRNTVAGLRDLLADGAAATGEISGVGITNQTGAFVLWDRRTGEPVHQAIGWQCGRGQPVCEAMSEEEKKAFLRASGCAVSPFLPAAKLRWLLDERPDLQKRAEAGELCFGSMDSWLIWKLTGGRVHATDYGNACITQLFNIYEKKWDDSILRILRIPERILPKVMDTNGPFGTLNVEGIPPYPILAVAGDSNAALFGQFGFERGSIKITYGTGASLLYNIGQIPVQAINGFSPVIAWSYSGTPTYVLEGTAVCAGDSLVWLKEVGIIRSAAETEATAAQVSDNGGVYFVSAFTGLGTPNWNPTARACIVGMGRGTSKAHVIRAALEGIAYQIADMYYALPDGMPRASVLVDGGATRNRFLMQFQSDLLGSTVTRRICEESSALGVAYMAGAPRASLRRDQAPGRR